MKLCFCSCLRSPNFPIDLKLPSLGKLPNVYNTCKFVNVHNRFMFIKFHNSRFEKKANRMLMKASQTLGQSTGLNLGTRRPALMGNYYLTIFLFSCIYINVE